MLGFLTGLIGIPSPAKILFMLGMSAAIFGGGFYTAWHYKGLEEQASVVQAVTKVEKTEEKQAAATETVSEKAAEKQVEIQTRTITQIKVVTKYVTSKADSACVVNTGFVQLHNAAASGQDAIPATAGKPDGATAISPDSDSGVKLSEVASTVIQNYGTYQQVSEQLRELQQWVTDQQKINAP